jgi:AAA+ superfamily predicted ATPase
VPTDPRLLAALTQALSKDPGSTVLRLHLASLLLDSGAEAAALEHYNTILARNPADLDALRGAARASEALGDSSRAQGYVRLVQSLEGSAPESPTPPTDARVSTQPDESPAADSENDGRVPAVPLTTEGEDADTAPWWEIEKPDMTMANVGGMEDVKRRINVSFLAPMRNPAIRQAYKKSLRGGLMLFGPPGCGKTYIARATAGELGAKFMAVGLNDVLDMWLGQSEQRLHEIFELARRNAPCVIFFDEIDALGQKRTQQRVSAGRNVVNQLLSELDGVQAGNEGVFVLGATNHPWDVDSALLRPGRFDRLLLVLPPDEPARGEILRHHMEGRPQDGLDVAWIAGRTKDFSGADLAALCETAAEGAMEESLTTGAVRPIGMHDFKKALEEVHPSTGPWFEAARNVVMFSNQSGIYDDLASYMRAARML